MEKNSSILLHNAPTVYPWCLCIPDVHGTDLERMKTDPTAPPNASETLSTWIVLCVCLSFSFSHTEREGETTAAMAAKVLRFLLYTVFSLHYFTIFLCPSPTNMFLLLSHTMKFILLMFCRLASRSRCTERETRD